MVKYIKRPLLTQPIIKLQECLGVYPLTFNKKNVYLFSGRGKNPVVVIPSNTVERNEGETFVAECRVVTSITGKIVFFKENSNMEIVNKTRTKITLRKGSKFRNLTMTIANLTVNDSGTYRCTEQKLTNQKASVNLKVNGKWLD